MPQAVLENAKLAALVEFLAARQTLVGPVALGHGQYRFAPVGTLAELILDYLPTVLPPKKYFLPPRETLLHYDTSAGQQMTATVETEELVLFGVHTCDLAGIQCLNLVFSERPRDLHYQERKNHITLIGLECTDYCDSHASCALMHNHLPKGGYDLFLTPLAGSYFVDINTHVGELLVEESGLFLPVFPTARTELNQLRRAKRQRFQGELPIRMQELPRLLAQSDASPVWAELGDRCLSCGNCTNVCPTCYCFDLVDELELGRPAGRRQRVWDSCQHEDFAKVAGGESFRASRLARQRHRFNRKFHYPLERYRRLFCTGCGRCSRTCMAQIDLKQTLAALIEEQR